MARRYIDAEILKEYWFYIGHNRWLTCDIIGRHSFDGVKEWIKEELQNG